YSSLSLLTRPPRSPLFPYTTLFRSIDAERPRCERARRERQYEQQREMRPHASPVGTDQHDLPGGVDAPVDRVVPRCRLHPARDRSEEHTSELQSLRHLVCRLLLEKK